jgi:hypothetical protein
MATQQRSAILVNPPQYLPEGIVYYLGFVLLCRLSGYSNSWRLLLLLFVPVAITILLSVLVTFDVIRSHLVIWLLYIVVYHASLGAATLAILCR